jgi:hypothetical protein
MNNSVNLSSALFSFHTVIDEDFACVKYALLSIGANPSFDFSKIKNMSYIELLEEIYYRKYNNPLYCIKSDNADIDLLDRVYEEMIHDRELDVLEYAKYTDIVDAFTFFKSQPQINAKIMYYNDAQHYILSRIKAIDESNLVSFNQAIKDAAYTGIYLKTLSEYTLFKDKIKSTTFYISTAGINFNEDNSDILLDKNDINELIMSNNRIGIFDIYKFRKKENS